MTPCGHVAGSTKREPTVVGKPAEFMLANIASKFGLRRDQICMVGDRLDTDILFGQHGGLTTMLVLSGTPHRAAMAFRSRMLCEGLRSTTNVPHHAAAVSKCPLPAWRLEVRLRH